MQDVAAVPVDEVGDGGDFAFGIGTGDEKDGGRLHGWFSRGTSRWTRLALTASPYQGSVERRDNYKRHQRGLEEVDAVAARSL